MLKTASLHTSGVLGKALCEARALRQEKNNFGPRIIKPESTIRVITRRNGVIIRKKEWKITG